MESHHFDDLTRTLAASRRGALKALAALAAGGLLALLDGADGAARRPPRRPRPPRPPRHPRPGICDGRRDGARCGGECGFCQGGQCVADSFFCLSCETCDANLRCVPKPDGGRCFECGECLGGECVVGNHQLCPTPACQSCDLDAKACVPFNDGDPGCAECGRCQGGQCLPDTALCFLEPVHAVCRACDEATLTCVPDNQGGACGGECGICLEGLCVANSLLCDEECALCNPDLFICEPDPDVALPCGGECGVCQGGICTADTSLCADPDCQTYNAQTKSCDPLPDDTVCAGECGVCQGGVCVAGGCQEPECNACNPDTAMCEPINEGGPCGACGECQGGQCVNEGDCGDCGDCAGGVCVPDNERCALDCEVCLPAFNIFTCLPSVDGSTCGEGGICQNGGCVPLVVCPPGQQRCGPVSGPVFCCDPTSPSCEFCLATPGPGGTVFECRPSDIAERCASRGLPVLPGSCGSCCVPPGEPCQQDPVASWPCCSGSRCDITQSPAVCP